MTKILESFHSPLEDKRISGKSWMVKMTVGNYLQMIDLESNPFQRSLLSIKFYAKLIEDLLNNSTIPPISVVYPFENIELQKGLDSSAKFQILDGLQRTNCLLQCIDQLKKNIPSGSFFKDVDSFKEKVIYVEIWEKLELKSILYKMVVLNTGQKKMDYTHQLDILSSSVNEKLKSVGIEVITKREIEEDGRNKDKFALSLITEGLVSYINRTPVTGKKSAAEFLFERLNVETGDYESEMNAIYDDQTYDHLIWVLKPFNNLCSERYKENNPLLTYDPFLPSFMASLGYCNKKNREVLNRKIQFLENSFRDAGNLDPLDIATFLLYYKKFNTSIGDKRRRLIYETFKDYFMYEHIDKPEWALTYDRLY